MQKKINNKWHWNDNSNDNYIKWRSDYTNWNGSYLMRYKTDKTSVPFNNTYFPEKDISKTGFVCEIDNFYKPATVSYNANNGTGAPAAQIKVLGETLTLSSIKPIRAGYIFKEWNTKADGSGTTYESGAIYTNDEDVTLYAQWEYITPHAESTVTKVNNSLLVSTKLINITSGKILVGGHDEGSLVSFATRDCLNENETFELNEDIDTVKVMVWDGLTSMKPLDAVEVIPQSVWMTEN